MRCLLAQVCDRKIVSVPALSHTHHDDLHVERTLAAMSLIMLIVLLATVGRVTSIDKQVCISGRDCTLNCMLEGSGCIELVEWTREDLKPNVCSYHASDSAYSEHSQFKNRLRFLPEALKSGNATLTIINVKKSENGTYTCSVKPEQPQLSRRKRAADTDPISTIQLVVEDPAKETGTQNKEEPHNTHSEDVLRHRIPLILSIVGLMAAVACVVGQLIRRREFLRSQNQPAKVPTEEQV